jgi:hypothetical protein
VVDRFNSIGKSNAADTSATQRATTLSKLGPTAASAPVGHGLGTSGEATKLTGPTELRTPDNGYLALMYQVGPAGFMLVIAALAIALKAAWDGARIRAPGQDLRLLLFAMLVFWIVQLGSGDSFYGSHGVIIWFICGQVFSYEVFRRRAQARARDREAELVPA